MTSAAVIQAATVFTISPLGLKLPEGLAELHWSRKAGVCGGNRGVVRRKDENVFPSSPVLPLSLNNTLFPLVHYPARLHSPEELEPLPLYRIRHLAWLEPILTQNSRR